MTQVSKYATLEANQGYKYHECSEQVHHLTDYTRQTLKIKVKITQYNRRYTTGCYNIGHLEDKNTHKHDVERTAG